MAEIQFTITEPEVPCNYYTADNFNKLYVVAKHGFSVFHMNARSLQNKIDDIEIFLTPLNTIFDVLMFTETWYSAKASPIQFPEYTCLHIDRTSKSGGGVALYPKYGLSMTVIESCSVTTADVECLVAQHRETFFVVLYRPPPETSESFAPILNLD